jgi:hypothetical protein
MKNKITLLSVLVMLGLFTSMSANASRMHYNMANNTARALAQSAWDNIGEDCTKTSKFIRIVSLGVNDAVRDIGKPPFTGQAAQDFGQGYIDGLMTVLRRVVKKCVNECNMLGDAMGGWAAKMFCRVSNVIGAPARFTNRVRNVRGGVCGSAYRSGCESNFVSTAKNMCRSYTRNRDALKDYYKGNRGGCCAYNPY